MLTKAETCQASLQVPPIQEYYSHCIVQSHLHCLAILLGIPRTKECIHNLTVRVSIVSMVLVCVYDVNHWWSPPSPTTKQTLQRRVLQFRAIGTHPYNDTVCHIYYSLNLLLIISKIKIAQWQRTGGLSQPALGSIPGNTPLSFFGLLHPQLSSIYRWSLSFCTPREVSNSTHILCDSADDPFKINLQCTLNHTHKRP